MKVIQFVFLVTSLFLTACGGGSGGGDDSVAPERPAGGISGVGFDGLIIGGSVRVYEFDSGQKGALLGSTRTDGQGYYSINFSAPDGPVLIEIDGGYYLEESSGKQVQVDPSRGLKLLAVDYYYSGSELSTSATFFSTIATGLTEFMVNEQGLDIEVAIERAYAQLDGWAGFDVRKTVPVDVSDSANVTPYVTDQHLYGFVAAAISELTRVVGERVDGGVHDNYTSIKFILEAYRDVKFDGQLNGVASSGTVSYGDLIINSFIYRDKLAVRMLQFVESDRNYTSLNFDQMLPFASRINVYADDLFGNTVAPDITEASPSISQFLPAEGEVISGSYQTSIIASDDYGIESIEFYVDGGYVGEANPQNGRFSLDTLNFSNGSHTIEVVVTNIMDNSERETHNIFINNGNLSFSSSSSHQGNNQSGYEAEEVCNISLTINDSTGLGVDLLQQGHSTLLSRVQIPETGLTINTTASVPGWGHNQNRRLEQEYCSLHQFTASDYLGGSYQFGVAVRRWVYKRLDYTRTPYTLKFFEFRCNARVANSC